MNSEAHLTEDRIVDGTFCSCTDDESERSCDRDVTVDTVGDVTVCTSARGRAPESISHGGD